MPNPQGLVSFPGIAQAVSCTYTRSHGISPGIFTLECAPQDGLEAEVGPVVFTFAGGNPIVFPGCKVDRHSMRYTTTGKIWQLQIVDRRWKWLYGELSGHYNLRMGDNTLDPDHLQTPQQLCTLCLLALGETQFDVSQVPNDTNPLVEWERVNPAQALDSLASLLGCRVVLRIDDTIAICRTGFGAPLPDGQAIEDSLSLNPPRGPDSIRFVAGKTIYQTDLLLEAVGLDVGGEIRQIDELTYKPQQGWDNQIPGSFISVPDNPGNPIEGVKIGTRPLAIDTVFRWYRIAQPNGAITVPGYAAGGGEFGHLVRLEQILPIDDYQVEGGVDESLGLDANGQPKQVRLPALVYGIFWNGNLKYANGPVNEAYRNDFEIDRERGIVKFARPVVAFRQRTSPNDPLRVIPATLWLRTGFNIHRQPDFAWEREEIEVQTGLQNGTGPRILLHDEIELRVNDNGPINDGIINTLANYYIGAALLDYQTQFPQERLYPGLVPVELDGAIQQVSFQVSTSGGCTTRAMRNNEFDPAVPTYQERRLSERLRYAQARNALDKLGLLDDVPPHTIDWRQ